VKRGRHTPEQIIRKLREAERMLGEGKTIPEAAKGLQISEQTQTTGGVTSTAG
jgi:putative transposase